MNERYSSWKVAFFLMLFLIGDVSLDGFEIGGAHRENAVSGLPCEIPKRWIALLDPNAGNAFEFLDPIGLGDRASLAGQDVNVVFHTANDDGRTVDLFRDPSEIGMHFMAQVWSTKEGLAVFGGKDCV